MEQHQHLPYLSSEHRPHYILNISLIVTSERVRVVSLVLVRLIDQCRYRTTAWFMSGTNIHLHGGSEATGTIDGNGQIWWDALATNHDTGSAGGSSRTFARPIPLTVGNATNVLVENLNIINSPFWHNFVYQSKNVVYR